jgi:hypothetical protein
LKQVSEKTKISKRILPQRAPRSQRDLGTRTKQRKPFSLAEAAENAEKEKYVGLNRKP